MLEDAQIITLYLQLDKTAETLQPATSVTTQEAENLIDALVDAK